MLTVLRELVGAIRDLIRSQYLLSEIQLAAKPGRNLHHPLHRDRLALLRKEYAKVAGYEDTSIAGYEYRP